MGKLPPYTAGFAVNIALGLIVTQLGPSPMTYKPIDELNISDAVRHLEDARRMNDQERIRVACTYLQRQLDLIKEAKPALYQKYLNLLE